MARPKRTATAVEPLPPVNTQAFQDDAIALRTVAEDNQQDAMDEVLAAGIDLGRVEALEFIATVATSAQIQIFENVKKSKAWKFLRNPNNCDGRKFESLNEFCEVKLGKTYRRLQEITANRTLLGQEAFEQAERIGLHQRDYNAIKALPAPDQELIRRAVEEAGTREEVLDLMQELAVRHGQERAEQEKTLSDAQAEQRALEKLHAEAATKNRELTAQLEKFQLRTAPWDAKVADFKDEITKRQALIDEAVARHTEAVAALDAWLTQELASLDGYDPEAAVDLPAPIQTVLLHLDECIGRTASLAATARATLYNRFGGDIDQARLHVLEDDTEAQ